VSFEEFEKEVRRILRLQDKKQVDIFLSIGEKILGFYEMSKEERLDRVERHYEESISGGVPKDMANKSSGEYNFNLIMSKYRYLIPDRHYKPSSSLAVQEQKRALRYLKELVRLQIKRKVEGLYLNLDNVLKSIEFIEESLKFNQVMNTGGKPTTLSDQDLSQLGKLKILYTVCFPENPNSYKSGSLLNKLGEVLIEKSVPRNIDRLVEKAADYIRNYEENYEE
jgi:hypothetical protein